MLETLPVGNAGKFWKSRFLCAPRRGFLPVRKAHFVSGSKDGPWTEYAYVESLGFTNLKNGFWFPGTIILEDRGASTDPAKCKLLFRYTVRADGWKVRDSFEDEDFTLRFSPGINVQDEVAGGSYIALATNDQLIADQITSAGRLQRTVGHAWSSRRTTWVLGSITALLALLCFRRRFISSREGGVRGS